MSRIRAHVFVSIYLYYNYQSQFGLAIFLYDKTPQSYHEDRISLKCLLNVPVTVDR